MRLLKKPQAAFTLLELLVVLAILGAMLSLVAPNISIDSDEESLEREAQTLRFELQKIAENAWLSGSTSIISLSNGQWTQWIPVEANRSDALGTNSSDETVKWMQEDAFHESDVNIRYDYDVELKALKQALSALSFSNNAQFVFLASGEYLPFSILLHKGELSLTVTGDGINAIEIR
ncbi:prepilin-type N-terminal cleavage/methylation domain-containing protein [Marinomonas balearica]|uniref:Type II secretion system protein H n=1 Tax=Marinomonas balearica TaxID=491947 RepID=A0A4R6MAQ2_9GAMM|nr:prepilin-type N-terminal cleavage/methylation domain-containing protein [Marinomonas balearica]TDO98165.1 type II secretion system protein H [Marinomonas balearica]